MHRFVGLFRSRPLEDELDAEVCSHLEMAIAANLGKG